ncbi:MAG: hypothetical protein RIQ52_178 [Pseudomonadota bacterium]|jgi:hypothetical protein
MAPATVLMMRTVWEYFPVHEVSFTGKLMLGSLW